MSVTFSVTCSRIQNSHSLVEHEECCESEEYRASEVSFTRLGAYPMTIFRFGSTRTVECPPSQPSPKNACGTRCKKTSPRSPPVANAIIVLSEDGSRVAGTANRMKFGILHISKPKSSDIPRSFRLTKRYRMSRGLRYQHLPAEQ